MPNETDTSDLAKALGQEIASFRKEKGLTQKELAQKAHINLTALRRCEQKGQITLPLLLHILQALGATLQIQPPKNRLPETWEKLIRLKSKKTKPKKHERPKLGGLWDTYQAP